MTDIPSFLSDTNAIVDDYKRQLQLRRQREVAAFDSAVQKDPTLFAKQRQLSQLSGLPQDAVEARYDEIQKIMRAKALDDAARFAANPVLAASLRNRDFSAAVHDDLASLQKAEGLFSWIGQQWDSGSLTRRRGELGARFAMGWATTGDMRELEEIDRRLRSLPPREGLLEKTVGGTLEILGQWLPSIPAALAAGAGGAAVGSVAGPGGAGTGFTYGFGSAMTAQAVVTEGGAAYLDYVQAGYGEDGARKAALGVGLVNGALEAVGFRLASAPLRMAVRKTVGRRLASELTQQTAGALWGSVAKSYLTAVGSEVVTEVLQESVSIAGEELLRAYTRPELASKLSTEAGREEIADRVLGVAQKTFEGMLLLGLPGPVARLQGESRRAEVVDSQTKILEALQKGAAVEPKLLERAPDLFHQFTADAAGQTVPELTIDAAAFLQLLRDANAAQESAGRAGTEKSVTDSIRVKMPGLIDDLETKAERGEDVSIPTADFVTHLAKTPLGSSMLQHLRVDPDALSQSERDRSAPLLKELAKEAEKIVKDTQDNSKQILESAKKVMQRQLEELKATNRFTGADARANARLYTNFVVINAARAKMTPEEFDAQFRLTTSAQGAQLQQAAVDTTPTGEQSVLLNIGLDIPAGGRLTPEQALEAVRATGAKVLRYSLAQSDSEQTASIAIDAPLSPEVAHQLSAALQQEAIVQRLPGRKNEGGVFGPQAEKWGTFTPKFFVMLNGSRADTIPQTGDQNEQNATASNQAGAGGLPDTGGVRGSDGLLAQQGRPDLGAGQPLAGLPAVVKVDGRDVTFGPFQPARDAARRYAERSGLAHNPPTVYVKVDPERAARIAAAFDAMPHDPQNPDVKAAYDAMIRETLAQWEAIKETGLVVEFITGADPYGNPRNAILDVVQNNHLWVFPTDAGFGGSESANVDISGNPLLQVVEGETISGRPVRANDIFRVVHDYFGHVMEGVGFRAEGEENAWQQHMAMFSPLARKALTTETRGQNSWVNFGPFAKANRTANGADTQYAPQKIGVLPDWVLSEGYEGDKVFRQSGAGFFSALLRGVQALNVKSLTADSWKQQLKGLQNKGIVKAEELEWTGVTDWLDMQEGKVTREAVEAYLQERGVQVETLTMSGNDGTVHSESVRYADYVTRPGGANYREVLLRTPTTVQVPERRFKTAADLRAAAEAGSNATGWGLDVWEEAAKMVELTGGYDEALRLLGELTANGAARQVQRDAANLLRSIAIAHDRAVVAAHTTGRKGFRSTHWGPLNVLAHIRTSDFSEGRVLRVHELQSDWGQAARDRGTFNEERMKRLEQADRAAQDVVRTAKAAVDERINEILPNSLVDSRGLRSEADQATLDADVEYQSLVQDLRKASDDRVAARKALEDYSSSFEDNAPPDGPFIRTTEGWLNLALKKLLMMAVEGGYQRIEFATGAEVAEMFSLDRAVQSMSVREPTKADSTGIDRVVVVEMRDERGTSEFEVNADGTIENANDFDAAAQVEGKQLSEVFGAEVAQWAMGAPFGEERRGNDLLQSEGMRGFYDKIVPAAASKLAKKLGGKVTQDGRLQIEITDEMREQVAGGLPLFQEGDGPRGWFDPERLRIILSRDADASTWLHELAHYFLTVYSKLAEMPQVENSVKEDMQVLLDWFGVPDIATWNAMPIEQQRKHHESFAYNFERWLFEGKAPTQAQQRLFDRFMDWIRTAYRTMLAEVFNAKIDAAYAKDVGGPLPELSPEVRAVMGRMLAAEDEVRSATVRDGAVPLFQTKEEFIKAGGNEDEWTRLQEAAVAADRTAVAQLTQDSMRQMVWLRNARSKVLRRLQAEKEQMREKLREEEAPRMALLRTYRAIEWLQTGVVRDAEGAVLNSTTNHKLNRAAVKAIEPNISMGLVRRYTAENGVLPDDAAILLGFASGDEMVKTLLEAPPLNEAIEARVQQRLLEEHSELSDPKSIERAIDKALHNDARTRFVAAELRFLMRAEEPVSRMVSAAKEAARLGLLNRKVNELNPRVFVRGERRASQRAFEAMRKGDSETAIAAKRQQLLQEQLALQAIEASQEIDDALRAFEPITKPDEKVGKTREIALVGAARALLAAYQIGGSAEQRAAMLSRATELLEQVKAYNPAMFTEVAQLIGTSVAGATDYRQLTLAEFRVLRDTVMSLWWQAKRRKQVEIEGKLIERESALEAAYADLQPKVPSGPLPGENEAPSLRQRVVRRLQGLRSAARRAESLFDSWGPSLTRFLFRPVQAALDDYRVKRNELVGAFVAKLTELGKLPVGKIAAPEIGYTFGSGNGGLGIAELLGAMLHTGNASNFAKLLIGRGWVDPAEPFVNDEVNSSKWDELMKRLEDDGVVTKAHWDWVQSVWDLLEQTKPIAQKAHKALFGHYFKEVKSRPVTTRFGNYRGGYVPAKTDTFLVRDARINEGMEALEADFRQSLPTVGMGFTKARVEDYRKALSLDVRKIASHIDGVVRFTYVQPAIRDVLSMLRDPKLSAQMNAIDPVAVEGVILPWLTRAARQTTEQAGIDPTIDQFWRAVRTRTGMSTMFLNLSNASQQITGWFPAALKVKPSYLKGALRRYMAAPTQTAGEVAELSKFMANRFKNQMFELTDSINEVLLNPNKFEKLQKWAGRHTYVLQSAAQNMVDAVTWIGAHEQALANGAEDAVAQADAAVRLTQGSTDPEAVSRFEAGSPFVRTLTQFSGYFNMLANLNLTEFTKTVQALGWRGGASALFYVFVFGFAAPMLVSDAIARTFSGEWDDEDDDGYADEVGSWFFGGLGRGALALVPLGTVAAPLVNAWNDKPYDDRMMTSPAVSALEAATVGVIRATQAAIDPERDVTGKGVRDVLTLLTLLTGIPVSALGRPLGYALDASADRVEPYGVADTVRGLVTGRPAPGTRQP